MAQAADFFVSYTSADRAWAEWIARQLEAEGYTVIVQAWDFTPGRSWTHEMQHATATAERVVAVLSAAYLESEHGEAEWQVFQAKDPLGKRGLLLPVRVGEVDPPGLLQTRIYVDLVGRDGASARAALLAAARGTRGKPTEAPEFPGAQPQSRVSADEAPRFPGELPPVWNVPFHPNPFFTGRDLLLAELQARLQAPAVAVRRVVLIGLGGVGKTSVAVEYVYRHQADYDLVWWANGEQPASLLADLAALAAQLGLAADASQEAQVVALRSWLEHQQRWLVVLDNVDDPRLVAEWLPRSSTGQVVLTSRTGIGWEQLGSVLPVEALALDDAAGLLLGRTREAGPVAEATAATLAATLGGLPLALEQAGAYVASTGTVTLAGYAELFATRTLELLKRGQPLDYQHTVATTWSLALQQLRATEPVAVDLLTLMSFLAPDDLPQPLLATHHGELPEPLGGAARDPLALADAIATLRRYSLTRVVADGLYMHRLLQTVVRAALDGKAERFWAACAVRLLRSGFPRRSDEVAAWPEWERLLPHALAAADYGRRLDVEPEAWLFLQQQASVYLRRRGQYGQAADLQVQVLAARRQMLGDDHPDTLTSMDNLAETRRLGGELQAAHDLNEQTFAARQRILGDDHPDTLDSMDNLALTRGALGDLQGAHQLHEQTLTAGRRILGKDHHYPLISMNNLALTRRDLGDLSGARDLFEQVLAARQQMLGDDHPDTLTSMHNLALTRRDLGDLQGARELFDQALTARRRVLGDDHPATLWSMQSLAVVCRALGDLRGARELNEHALAARRRVLGDDHPDTLWSMDNLAITRGALGDLHGARELHEHALATRRRILGDDHPDTMYSMHGLAETRRELGDLYGARKLFEQTLAARRRILSDDHPDTLRSMRHLAMARNALGDLHHARELFEQILAVRRRILGTEHPDTLESMQSLAAMCRELGDLQDARELFEQTLAARRRVLGDDHPDTLWSMHGLARTLQAVGNLQGARALHEQTLAARRRVLGDDHPHTLDSMSHLAETRRDLGDLRGAHDLHEQTLAARQRVLGDDHPETEQSLSNLADLRRQLEGP